MSCRFCEELKKAKEIAEEYAKDDYRDGYEVAIVHKKYYMFFDGEEVVGRTVLDGHTLNFCPTCGKKFNK